MTSNMIAYRNYLEQSRHNREMERLTGEQQAEVKRHDVAVEQESARSNIANESIKHEANVINATHYGKQDYENARHHGIEEYYTMQLAEAYGQNEAKAKETYASAEQKSAQAAYTYAQAENIKADTAKKKKEVELLGKQIAYADLQNQEKFFDVWYKPDEKKAELALTEAKAGQAKSSGVSGFINAVTNVVSLVFGSSNSKKKKK